MAPSQVNSCFSQLLLYLSRRKIYYSGVWKDVILGESPYFISCMVCFARKLRQTVLNGAKRASLKSEKEVE